MRLHANPRKAYWQANLRLIALLLSVWCVSTFGVAWFAPDLDWNFFGWRFSFYMSAQGSLLVCLLLVWLYARLMLRLDRRFGIDEDPDG